MKRALILLIALSLFLPASSALAAGKGSFWSSLRSRIRGITPKKQAAVTTAVGGVRGALSDEANGVYWKGKDIMEVNEEELQKFNSALLMADDGDTEGSIKAFETFLKEYPDSSLRIDALDAISTLRPRPERSLPAFLEREPETTIEMDAEPQEIVEETPLMEESEEPMETDGDMEAEPVTDQ